MEKEDRVALLTVDDVATDVDGYYDNRTYDYENNADRNDDIESEVTENLLDKPARCEFQAPDENRHARTSEYSMQSFVNDALLANNHQTSNGRHNSSLSKETNTVAEELTTPKQDNRKTKRRVAKEAEQNVADSSRASMKCRRTREPTANIRNLKVSYNCKRLSTDGSTSPASNSGIMLSLTSDLDDSDNSYRELCRETVSKLNFNFTDYRQQQTVNGSTLKETCQSSREHRRLSSKITKNFAGLVLSSILWMASFSSLQYHQSTLNPRRTMGVISMAMLHLAAIVSSFCAPAIVHRMSTRWTIVMGYIAHATYVVANFHPTGILLLPGAVVAGSMTGPLWTAQSKLLSTLADLDAISGRQVTIVVSGRGASHADHVRRLNGLFAGLLHNGPIWGNLVAALTLISNNETVQLFEPERTEVSNSRRRVRRSICSGSTTIEIGANQSTLSTSTTVRSISEPVSPVRFRCFSSDRRCCGVGADENVADGDSDDDDVIRVPHHGAKLPSGARYWLVGVNTGFITAAALVSMLLIDSDQTLENSFFRLSRSRRRRQQLQHAGSVGEGLASKTSEYHRQQCGAVVTSLTSPISGSVASKLLSFRCPNDSKSRPFTSCKQLITATARVLRDPHIQLVAPLICFCGFSRGFITTDFTKVNSQVSSALHREIFVAEFFDTIFFQH
jgi:hypothetical protein